MKEMSGLVQARCCSRSATKSRSASQETEPEDALEEIKAFCTQEKFPAFFLPATPAQHRTKPFSVAYERKNRSSA
jgi:hypothetical protein